MDVACCKMEQILNTFQKILNNVIFFFKVLAKISCYVERGIIHLFFVFILLEIKNYNFIFIFVPFQKHLFFIFIIFFCR